jgi:HlyD family type I secretion membrane fusion protein
VNTTSPLPQLADSPRREAWLGAVVAVLFFVVLLGGLAAVRVDAAAYATGRVEVVGSRQAVQHPEGGVVTSLKVQEGQLVRKGQLLVVLNAPVVNAEVESLKTQVIQLRALRCRLVAEQSRSPLACSPESLAPSPEDVRQASASLAATSRQLAVRKAALSTQRGVIAQRGAQLREQIVGLERQIAANLLQQNLIEQELEGVRALAEKGYAPLSRVRELERGAASLEGAYGEYQALVARAREAIGENALQSLGVDWQRSEEVGESLLATEARLGELEPRLRAAIARQEAALVRAPASGRVVGLSTFTVGGVIGTGQRIMDIVPQDTGLTIVAQVSPNDADDLEIGTKAEVRFSSIRGRRIPQVWGKIITLSADSIVDERTGVSFYRAEIRVPPVEWEKLSAPGNETQIRPGVPVEVVVPIRRRTAISYLVEPIRQSFWRSFREH